MWFTFYHTCWNKNSDWLVKISVSKHVKQNLVEHVWKNKSWDTNFWMHYRVKINWNLVRQLRSFKCLTILQSQQWKKRVSWMYFIDSLKGLTNSFWTLYFDKISYPVVIGHKMQNRICMACTAWIVTFLNNIGSKIYALGFSLMTS